MVQEQACRIQHDPPTAPTPNDDVAEGRSDREIKRRLKRYIARQLYSQLDASPLGADVRLAPGTVARAYRELEGAGLVMSGGRRGTRVADAPPVPDAQVVAGHLDDAARTFAVAAVQLGVDLRAALDAAQRAFAAVDPT